MDWKKFSGIQRTGEKKFLRQDINWPHDLMDFLLITSDSIRRQDLKFAVVGSHELPRLDQASHGATRERFVPITNTAAPYPGTKTIYCNMS